MAFQGPLGLKETKGFQGGQENPERVAPRGCRANLGQQARGRLVRTAYLEHQGHSGRRGSLGYGAFLGFLVLLVMANQAFPA